MRIDDTNLEVGMLLRNTQTNTTAIVTHFELDAKLNHRRIWWWILDSEMCHYRESSVWMSYCLRRDMWQIVQEVTNENG